MTEPTLPEPTFDYDAVKRVHYEQAGNLRADVVRMLACHVPVMVGGVREAFEALRSINDMVARVNASRPDGLAPIPPIAEDRITAPFRRAGLTISYAPPASDGRG